MAAFSPIDFYLNAVLAVSSAFAVLIAALTLRQAYKFKQEEQKSKRAFIAPESEPGYFRRAKLSSGEAPLHVRLMNYGQNPATSISVFINGIVKTNNKTEQEELVSIIHNLGEVNNPIPFGSKINLKGFSSESIGDEMNISLCDYFIVVVKYRDKILNRDFIEKFYWGVGDDDLLKEVSMEDKKKLERIKMIGRK